MFKVSNRNTRKSIIGSIGSKWNGFNKLTTKTTDVVLVIADIADFEHISHLILMLLLLTFSSWMFTGKNHNPYLPCERYGRVNSHMKVLWKKSVYETYHTQICVWGKSYGACNLPKELHHRYFPKNLRGFLQWLSNRTLIASCMTKKSKLCVQTILSLFKRNLTFRNNI